jgi:hypothetical protein
MANQVHKFKDRDIQRVIKAVRSAGLDPAVVEVDPHTGKITVFGGKAAAAKQANELDQWMSQHADDDQGH